KNSFWYPHFLQFSKETALILPNSLLVVTLSSNFGTFMLYALTCYVAIVAFREHHSFSGFKHMFIPVFGLLANILCMAFYLLGPFALSGMNKLEPFIALGVAAVWGIYGAIYFVVSGKKKGKTSFVSSSDAASRRVAATG